MWALAKENKGNIVTRGWWGGSSSGDVGSVEFPNEMTIEEFESKYHRHPDSKYSRDINYLDDGQWEAVNPFIHWMSWNVQHK